MGNGNLYVHNRVIPLMLHTTRQQHTATHIQNVNSFGLFWNENCWKISLLTAGFPISLKLNGYGNGSQHTHRPVYIAIPLQIIWSNCVYFSRFCLPSPPSLEWQERTHTFRFEDGCAFATSMSSSYFLWQKVTRNLRALLQLIMFSLWHRKTFHSFEHVRVRRMRFTLVPHFLQTVKIYFVP